MAVRFQPCEAGFFWKFTGRLASNLRRDKFGAIGGAFCVRK